MKLLLEPLKAGNLLLKNRLVMPPMATSKADADGKVSRAILDYYDEKTRGGRIGLVITEHSFVNPQGKVSPNQLSVADDSVVEGLKELADVIHRHGSLAVSQINHAGSVSSAEITGLAPLAPSAVSHPNKKGGTVPHELTKPEIGGIVSDFANAARRVKEAGFDGVELHAAHGFLLHQFYSPLSNLRADDYGGNWENRIRLHLEVISAIRKITGDDFPILVRLGASDYREGGVTIQESEAAAQAFENSGVSILDISGGMNGSSVPGGDGLPGYFAPLSSAIKKKVGIPVILTGGITQAQDAERLLEEGAADLIGVGRAILNDSGWAEKELASLCQNQG
ncbi:MAG: NADH:flavin oxidoreductase [Planctomycetota bacterium]|nr:NADH:flavin oxidoreductase [Planctomycetota bacterium]